MRGHATTRTYFESRFMTHRHFDMGYSETVNIFKVRFWEGGGGHKKEYAVYARENDDNSGRPLTKLQLKKVDPFITKRAHQISVTMGPGPYLISPRKYPDASMYHDTLHVIRIAMQFAKQIPILGNKIKITILRQS